MVTILDNSPANGGPGIPPRWSRSDKHGLGTAHSDTSRVWFTVSKGILNEVYFPTIDRPQIRDLQFLLTDGQTFFQGERDLDNAHESLAPGTLGYRITNSDPHNRYRISKEVIAAPDQDCILMKTKVDGNPDFLAKLKLFVLIAPHLEVGGNGNNANIVDSASGQILTAHKNNTWLAVRTTIPLISYSCGYVGVNDGWHELKNNFKLLHNFDCALDGNIAITGELDISNQKEFVLALSFGDSLDAALLALDKSLSRSFEEQRSAFQSQWSSADKSVITSHQDSTGDGGKLFHFSRNLIRAHEDKTYKGAIIASLSIPWGEIRSDNEIGGYHLVWTRDMCHSATGLIAVGLTDLPLRALRYLACNQKDDGGFHQNFWVSGQPYWTGIQLDETAVPVILAWQLHEISALDDFDPYPMALKAAGYLIEQGPITPQERWEENSGYSPSTLAAQIAALICAGAFARLAGDESAAAYMEEYADFLESHLEEWTVTSESSLVPGISRHYVRINPADPSDAQAAADVETGTLELRNRQPGTKADFPAKEIVDAGFLELVRYGIRSGGDTLIEDSLKVVDSIIKVDTTQGSCWRRYNHDGYGQRRDGTAYDGWGYGHAWPVLTGERGHYELAAGRDAHSYIRAMESFASHTRLIPEQVWSLEDLPDAHMFNGRPTGGAMPLVWAHAEYLQLVRSVSDGRVFTIIDAVKKRYVDARKDLQMDIWKFNRQIRSVAAGRVLRIQTKASFKVHYSFDDWTTSADGESKDVNTGHHFVDLYIDAGSRAPVTFTLYWNESEQWEGRNFKVDVRQSP